MTGVQTCALPISHDRPFADFKALREFRKCGFLLLVEIQDQLQLSVLNMNHLGSIGGVLRLPEFIEHFIGNNQSCSIALLVFIFPEHDHQ